MPFLLKSCRKCGGDLVLDGDEWGCCQCGKYYYPQPPAPPPVAPDGARPVLSGAEVRAEGLPPVRRGQRPRSINTVLAALARTDQRWWQRNREIIRYLDEGRSAAEIAILVGVGKRYVRAVREKLSDLRKNSA